jgi:hypothetical protein
MAESLPGAQQATEDPRTLSWRELLLLDLALLSLMIVASRVDLLIHEVGGHGVLYKLFGGARAMSYKLSLFGGGFAFPDFGDGPPSEIGCRVAGLGGMALNLVTGVLAWVGARKLAAPRGLLSVFLLLAAAGAIGATLNYLALGTYYGEGDPTHLFPDSWDGRAPCWLWLVFVLPIPLVAFLATRDFWTFLAGHVMLPTIGRRLVWSALTIGVIVPAYAGLWYATTRPDSEPSLAAERVDDEIVREAVARKRESSPTDAVVRVTHEEIRRVSPEDVKDRVPPPVARAVTIGAAFLGALIALVRCSPRSEPVRLDPRRCLATVPLAAIALVVVAILGR